MNRPRFKVTIIPEQARVWDTWDLTYSDNGKVIFEGWTKDATHWAELLEAAEKRQQATL